MPAKKKRLKKLVDAVSALLGDQQKAKKLRKSEALARFIAKLEAAHKEMEKELEKKSLKGSAAKEKARRAESLAKQIRKAKRLLAEMK